MIKIHPFSFYLCVLLLISVTSCTERREEFKSIRQKVDLSGGWRIRLDTTSIGKKEKWFGRPFEDLIVLPGTLDENKIGYPNKDTTEDHLNRLYVYNGPAWFKKEIEIPALWKDSKVELVMERTKVTEVWIDSLYIGSQNTLFSKQVYDLTDKVLAGRKHTLTIVVDNNEKLVPSIAGSHAYSEDMQTNWNGILGDFYLEASNPIRIKSVKTFPDVHAHEIRIKVNIENNNQSSDDLSVDLSAYAWNTKKNHTLPVRNYPLKSISGDNEAELVYDMGEDVQYWSEFDPVVYTFTVTLKKAGKPLDNCQANTGMRKFKTKGTQFTINDLTIFLRGKHDAGMFPLTGYPPLDTTGWLRVFRIAKSYGINHYRFHSWCPPEAAFEAADIAGIYLQPELPIWWGFNPKDSAQMAFQMKEGKNMLDNYGNHPSFVMLSLGNELSQDREVLKNMVTHLRAHDNRPLYAQGSNNRLWDPSYAEGDDYWTTFRTGKEQPDFSTDVRGSVSFLDSKTGDGGIINSLYPATSFTYTTAISQSPVPVIGHEVGQYQVYPDYKTFDKYTGVLKPWNLELFRQRLKKNNMLDQASQFFKASGALSVLCYRADIEMALRTPGFGGFQLLDLQDYPGQGTALVGLLDPFMDSKGLITPDQFKQFCNDVVILAIMDKFTWKNDETFTAEIKVANYGATSLDKTSVKWTLASGSGQAIRQGKLPAVDIPQGTLATVGKIELAPGTLKKEQRLNLSVSIERSSTRNSYPIWVYPSEEVIVPRSVTVVNRLTSSVVSQLINGESVLLLADSSAAVNTVGGLFITDFWNYKMFRSLAEKYDGRISPGTMGILTDPKHAVFEDFPTEYHSNWQWWSIVRNSHPLVLDDLQDYQPIVQVIDNINRNHKLGLMVEFKVGKGRLLVCAAALDHIDMPEAKQLCRSMIHYMHSSAFNPSYEIDVKQLRTMFR